MPEGHTIHRYARQMNLSLGGQKLAVTSPQGRFEGGASLVDGHRLDTVEPLGKHLFFWFNMTARSKAASRKAVHVHLGMYGRFTTQKSAEGDVPDPRGQVRMRLLGHDRVVDLNGPTACDVMDVEAVDTLRERIGPDLLTPDCDRARIHRRILGSRAAIGTLLMDQSVVSGIGNIYRAECLYRIRIDPRTPGNALDDETLEKLLDDATALMKIGVQYGPIRTVEPDVFGKKRWNQLKGDERFWLYKRKTCRGCGGEVEVIEQAGRTVYLCPREQAFLGIGSGC
jgi:formamidopyrimidine-DNA glycosylase